MCYWSCLWLRIFWKIRNWLVICILWLVCCVDLCRKMWCLKCGCLSWWLYWLWLLKWCLLVFWLLLCLLVWLILVCCRRCWLRIVFWICLICVCFIWNWVCMSLYWCWNGKGRLSWLRLCDFLSFLVSLLWLMGNVGCVWWVLMVMRWLMWCFVWIICLSSFIWLCIVWIMIMNVRWFLMMWLCGNVFLMRRFFLIRICWWKKLVRIRFWLVRCCCLMCCWICCWSGWLVWMMLLVCRWCIFLNWFMNVWVSWWLIGCWWLWLIGKNLFVILRIFCVCRVMVLRRLDVCVIVFVMILCLNCVWLVSWRCIWMGVWICNLRVLMYFIRKCLLISLRLLLMCMWWIWWWLC